MRTRSRGVPLALAVSLFAGSLLAQGPATERISVDSAGVEGNGNSGFIGPGISITPDGRFVAFESDASNLVVGDGNGSWDIFVRDRQLGTTERVSVDSLGAEGNGDSHLASISADGRFVAFRSQASNLVAGDTNGFYDVFVRDRQNSTTEIVSVDSAGVQANSNCFAPTISADGRCVAFYSSASTLVSGDTNGVRDVFVRDRQLGTTERVSLDSAGAQGNGVSEDHALSSDGRFVVFESSATNLVAGDSNGASDIFLRDRQLGTTERVSVDSAGAQAGGQSSNPWCSSDGRFVVFRSYAANLVAGDSNGAPDVFLRDRQLGTTECASLDSAGVLSNGASDYPVVSADGRCVAFESGATNLVAGDTNGVLDVFLRDRLSGTTERASLGPAGAQGNGASQYAALSSSGRFVAFQSNATNLVSGDTNAVTDVFLRDRGAAPTAFCFGDGTGAACPCANTGALGKGCDNSAATGGAELTGSGGASLSNDTLVLTSAGELPHALSIFLQGTTSIAPINFGDGLRCAGGLLKRLYIRNATNGAVTAPIAGDPSISVRSSALGDPISAGSTRFYQVYYRDPVLGFCPTPPGNSWNISSGLSVSWGQ